MSHIGQEALGFCCKPIHGGDGSDVESTVVLVSPRKVSGLFGYDNGSEVPAIAAPHPYTFWSSDK
jgi:hypothetical protein